MEKPFSSMSNLELYAVIGPALVNGSSEESVVRYLGERGIEPDRARALIAETRIEIKKEDERIRDELYAAGKYQMVLGSVFAVAGVLITGASYFEALHLGRTWFISCFGMAGAGAYIAFRGFRLWYQYR